ncbi:SDR family NAD(P)-dependent oxidoreductase [Novosphingobium lentum]|uniref:SDR family NAD(P)-dependent oxidoreductase n=1 Tax=Novosphingobium lentum TaxID=145287 RepID=UPI000835B6B4|nr:SDR family NAD(P)-dependent oxidoreductase [Novosphingobium lentum]
MSGKIAVVTGGAGRIGRAVVSRLVAEGGHTVVADINLPDAQAVAAQYGDRAHAIAFDAGTQHRCAR